eukprot:6081453-Prymnesium_polylepis.1
MKLLRRQSRVPRRMLPARGVRSLRCAPRAERGQDHRQTACVALTVNVYFESDSCVLNETGPGP